MNRVSVQLLHPGKGLSRRTESTIRYGQTIGFSVLNDSYIVIELYEPSELAKPNSAVLLTRGDVLLLTGRARGWAYGISARTRDVLPNYDKISVNLEEKIAKSSTMLTFKRSTCVFAVFKEVRAYDPADLKKEKCVSEVVEIEKQEAFPLSTEQLSADLEKQHVHQLYDQIAEHFSHTRHTPWPKVENYVKSIPKGAKVLDIGCGNGKYMHLNHEIGIVGVDLSMELVKICQAKGFNVQQADCLDLPFEDGEFDRCLSIAMLHHISTVTRRMKAISEALRVLKERGELILCAWAQEQDSTSRRRFTSQDVLVPWKQMGNGPVLQRYCHVYVKGELESLFGKVGNNQIVISYYDRGNWVVIAQKITNGR